MHAMEHFLPQAIVEYGTFEGTPRELAELILDQLTVYPETHDQGTWVNLDTCETTMCIAGWAAAFTGSYMDTKWIYFHKGMHALGLTPRDAALLFIHTNNAQAVHAMQFLAKGDDIDWDKVMLGDRPDEGAIRITLEHYYTRSENVAA